MRTSRVNSGTWGYSQQRRHHSITSKPEGAVKSEVIGIISLYKIFLS